MLLHRAGNLSEIAARPLVRIESGAIYIVHSCCRPATIKVVQRAPQMSQRVFVRLAQVDQAPKELFACFVVAGGRHGIRRGGGGGGGRRRRCRVFIFIASRRCGGAGWQITEGDKKAD